MKATSKVMIGLGIVAVIIAAGIFLLLSNLDRIVAAAIEKYGSDATGTEVQVSSVRIRLREGEGSIRTLRVGNPAGFSSPTAFQLEDISVAVATDSVTGDPIVIDKVLVQSPRVTYEIDRSGRSNIVAIRKELEKSRKSGVPRTKDSEGTGRKIVIRKLIIENGEVHMKVAALPREIPPARIPQIELTNLGGQGGDSPTAIAHQVLRPLVNQAIAAASQAGLEQYLGKEAEQVRKALEEKAREKLGETGGKAVQDAEDAVKKYLGR